MSELLRYVVEDARKAEFADGEGTLLEYVGREEEGRGMVW
jgi:hypothetical protein